jgi:glycosyltransferase involved in cell wall biosynthesis
MVAETRRRLEEGGVSDLTVFTGRTRQDEGPVHLAAADILVSPHVPNADGTPFFGSPTKLFEYMAMGRAIVASDLYQIGDVLEHGRTAWLVSPGDADELAEGLRAVIEDASLRHRLAASARREVVAKHTWRAHTRRIVEALETRCG